MPEDHATSIQNRPVLRRAPKHHDLSLKARWGPYTPAIYRVRTKKPAGLEGGLSVVQGVSRWVVICFRALWLSGWLAIYL